jgi:hypothetical protein
LISPKTAWLPHCGTDRLSARPAAGRAADSGQIAGNEAVDRRNLPGGGDFRVADDGLPHGIALVLDHPAVWDIDPFGEFPHGWSGVADDTPQAGPVVTVVQSEFRPVTVRSIATAAVSDGTGHIRTLQVLEPFSYLRGVVISAVFRQSETCRDQESDGGHGKISSHCLRVLSDPWSNVRCSWRLEFDPAGNLTPETADVSSCDADLSDVIIDRTQGPFKGARAGG